MGLDYGTQRIGVALSDPLQMTAQPHTVLQADEVTIGPLLRRLVDEYEVERIVVGLPISLSGGESASAQGARRLADLARQATGLPVDLADERFTTKTAEEALIAGKVRRRRRKDLVDKVAAAVMLQHYLDARE